MCSLRISSAAQAANAWTWLCRSALPVMLAAFALAVNAEGLKAGDAVATLEMETITGHIVPARELEGKVALHYF